MTTRRGWYWRATRSATKRRDKREFAASCTDFGDCLDLLKRAPKSPRLEQDLQSNTSAVKQHFSVVDQSGA